MLYGKNGRVVLKDTNSPAAGLDIIKANGGFKKDSKWDLFASSLKVRERKEEARCISSVTL